jgi:hypothetical protein
MNKIYNIAVVGAGQLGSRHLQSLKGIQLDVRIVVIDPSQESLEIAKQRFAEIENNPRILSMEFGSDLSLLPSIVNLLVLATSSKGRASIIESICKVCSLENIILEKVLFQTRDEYKQVEELFKEKGTNAWVNCPRRMFTVYKELRHQLSKTPSVIFGIVDGTDWNLGSNAIHYIDIFSFLIGCTDYRISTSQLSHDIFPSKRQGYVDFTGSLTLTYSNGAILTLSSRDTQSVQSTITIKDDQSLFLIKEAQGKIYRSKLESDNVWVSKDFSMPYQSQLTSLVAFDILTNRSCDLTTFEESVKLHIPFVEALIEFLKEYHDSSMNHCPIT